MRFLHTSDWHIGASKFLPDFLERQADAIDQIYRIAEERGIKVVVVAGDLFDTADPSAEERDLLKTKLLQYDAAGFTTLVINGNHDHKNMTGRTALRYLGILTDHEKFQRSVVTERTAYYQYEDTIFILLCHEPKQFKRDCQQAIEDVRTTSIQLDYKHIVLVCHETLRGAISDTNYRLKDGEDVPPLESGESYDAAGDITYVAVGDIHMKQRMGPRTFYCGAPLQVKFGDQPDKGVLIVDTDDPDNPVFVPVESKKLVKVTDIEHIPDNAYVKLAVSKLEGLGSGLPGNVVRAELSKAVITGTLQMDLSLHETWLDSVAQNLDEEQMVIAQEEIADILSTIDC